jgi:hypothetical protein
MKKNMIPLRYSLPLVKRDWLKGFDDGYRGKPAKEQGEISPYGADIGWTAYLNGYEKGKIERKLTK